MEASDELDFRVAESLTLGELVGRTIKKFTYEYDFGDSWMHEIKVEGLEPLRSPVEVPECIDGARNGPPEDCGGIWGLANFVKAMKNPKHPEHEELNEWYGRSYDPEAFSVKGANLGIRRYLARRKKPERTKKTGKSARM